MSVQAAPKVRLLQQKWVDNYVQMCYNGHIPEELPCTSAIGAAQNEGAGSSLRCRPPRLVTKAPIIW